MNTLQVPNGFGETQAADINANGLVVGRMRFSDVDLYRAVLWEDGLPVNLGTLPGGNWSEAAAVNDSGMVVGLWGHTFQSPGFPHAFLWQDSTMISLELPLGPKSVAADINSVGQITGWMGQAPWVNAHGFVWDNDDVIDLGVIPGGFSARPYAINDRGEVVGDGWMLIDGEPSNLNRAFYWADGEMTNLGSLPDFSESGALGMNNRGQIVGAVWDENDVHAFIWQNGVMTDLNELIPRGSDLTLSTADAINDAGQISGQGSTLGFLLAPVAVPLGDLDLDCRVGTGDLLQLLANWGACEAAGICIADTNGDNTVNEMDLALLLTNWG